MLDFRKLLQPNDFTLSRETSNLTQHENLSQCNQFVMFATVQYKKCKHVEKLKTEREYCGRLLNFTHYETLSHKVKMQYVQIENILDTSIKHQISGQSLPC